MHHVLDASAMLAYLRGENGALVVDQLLRSPTKICYAHSVNLCEVYYDFLRSSDQETAKQAILDLLTDGVIERKDLSRQFWQLVGPTQGTRSHFACRLFLSYIGTAIENRFAYMRS